MDLSQFKCLRCLACCRQNGYVRLRPGEAEKIADFLGMDIYAFTDRYTILTRDRQTLSLKEKENHACIFLTDQGCRIHPVKPGQCLDFPHKWKFKAFEDICAWAGQAKKKESESQDT